MSAFVFDRAPGRVYWELTRACDLACRHCRTAAVRDRASDELTTRECQLVLDDLATAGPPAPRVIFTSGDPLKRPDLVDLVRYASDHGLGACVAPSATVTLTRDLVGGLKRAGVEAMSLSLDGPTPAHHDDVRGVLGCFGWTLVAAQRIVTAGIPLRINTLVTADTEPRLDEMAKLVARLGASRWSLFFLIRVGRAGGLRSLDPVTCEQRLRWLATHADGWPFTVSTIEAPHYRRIVVQAMRAAGRSAAEIRQSPIARTFGIRDGNGIMFIAANGDVTPSGFLPLGAGNVRFVEPLRIYRDAALFRALRTPQIFGGRCGTCEFQSICGGSRARAWATSGDVLGEDPLCTWQRPATAAA